MFKKLPTDIVRNISLYVPDKELGSLSESCSIIHTDLVQELQRRHAAFKDKKEEEEKEKRYFDYKNWYIQGAVHRSEEPAILREGRYNYEIIHTMTSTLTLFYMQHR